MLIGPRVPTLLKGEHIDLRTFVEIMEILKVEKPPTLMDSQAKYAVTAPGRADLLIRCPAKRVLRDTLSDHAAGSIIVEEAGGRVTDLQGGDLDFTA